MQWLGRLMNLPVEWRVAAFLVIAIVALVLRYVFSANT